MGLEQSAWVLEVEDEMRHHRQEEHLLLCVPLLVSTGKVVMHLVHLVLVVRK